MSRLAEVRDKVTLVVLDEPEKKGWQEEQLLADFTVRVTTQRDRLIEERFKVFLNDRPKSMSDKNWQKLLQKVLRVEYYNMAIKGGKEPYGAAADSQTSQEAGARRDSGHTESGKAPRRGGDENGRQDRRGN